MWGDRVEATIYSFNSQDWSKKIAKLAKKTGKKGKNHIDTRNQFMEKAASKDSTLSLSVTKAKYSKGDNDIIDGVAWEEGLSEIKNIDDEFVLVYINRVIPPEPKKLNEAKGIITADYQNFLEKEWLEQLRNKYDISINEEVFNNMVE